MFGASSVGGLAGGGVDGTPGNSDGHFDSVVLLTSLDAATPTDQSDSNHTLTVSGATRDTTDKKFGASSFSFGTSSEKITAADSADWNFGAGDFTVECFVFFDSAPTGSDDPVFVSHFLSTGNQRSWMFWIIDGDIIFTYTTNGSTQIEHRTAWAPSGTTWYHATACRVGGEIILYVDGVEFLREANTATFFDATALLTIGHPDAATVTQYQRNVDEVRITKGVGRYPTAFTPPVAPFPTR